MSGNLTGSAEESAIDYYAETNVTPGALTLLNHPILHSVRIRNHMRAEGIDRE